MIKYVLIILGILCIKYSIRFDELVQKEQRVLYNGSNGPNDTVTSGFGFTFSCLSLVLWGIHYLLANVLGSFMLNLVFGVVLLATSYWIKTIKDKIEDIDMLVIGGYYLLKIIGYFFIIYGFLSLF